MQPSTVLISHDWLSSEPVGWLLNTSRWGLQVLLGHVKKSDGNRGTLEISDGDTCFEQWYVHDMEKGQTMPTEYFFKRVHGAGDLIRRRFVIEVDITAATSLLKHAASSSFQYLVEGEIINMLMLRGISPRGAHAVGVVELRKLLIKNVLSDATDDHVQELAAMEATPTAGDFLERVINEDNLGKMGGLVAVDTVKDVHEDVQKHGKRVSRPHKTRSKARAAPVDHLESTVEEPLSAGIAPAPEHEIAPAPRATPPSAAAQIEPRKFSAVEAHISLPMAVGCSISCHSDKACEAKYKHKFGPPRSRTITWSTAALPFHVALAHVFQVGMGVSRSQDWRSMHLGPGRPR